MNRPVAQLIGERCGNDLRCQHVADVAEIHRLALALEVGAAILAAGPAINVRRQRHVEAKAAVADVECDRVGVNAKADHIATQHRAPIAGEMPRLVAHADQARLPDGRGVDAELIVVGLGVG